MKSVLFCDSNCELWYDKLRTVDVKLIRMPYFIDGAESFYDMGEKTDFKAFFDKMRAGVVPVTSALNPQNYIEYFEPVMKEGKDIIYLSFSHQLSATFNHMQTALNELKETYPGRKVNCIDMKSISGGSALIVYLVGKYAATGKSDEEVVNYAEDLISRAQSSFTVDDLKYLKRGGRISGAAAVFGTLLSIKPMLCLDGDGKIINFAKAKGRRKAIEMLIERAKEMKADTKYPFVILSADAVKEDTDLLISRVKEEFPKAEIWMQPVGPVIGTHCGPGTLGLCYISEQKK